MVNWEIQTRYVQIQEMYHCAMDATKSLCKSKKIFNSLFSKKTCCSTDKLSSVLSIIVYWIAEKSPDYTDNHFISIIFRQAHEFSVSLQVWLSSYLQINKKAPKTFSWAYSWTMFMAYCRIHSVDMSLCGVTTGFGCWSDLYHSSFWTQWVSSSVVKSKKLR